MQLRIGFEIDRPNSTHSTESSPEAVFVIAGGPEQKIRYQLFGIDDVIKHGESTGNNIVWLRLLSTHTTTALQIQRFTLAFAKSCLNFTPLITAAKQSIDVSQLPTALVASSSSCPHQ